MAQSNLFPRVSSDRWPVGALALGAISLGGVFAADVATGADLTFGPFYLLVVLAVTWYAGPSGGWVFACVAVAALTTAAVLSGHPYPRAAYFAAEVAGHAFALVVTVILASRLRAAHDRAHASARTDAVTGLPNRAALHEALDLELARLRRFGRTFALVYLDCDNFREVNEAHGHARGDEVLRVVAETLGTALRRTDLHGRLGSDEFAVLLPETDAAACGIVVEQLRERLLDAMRSRRWPVTFSMGAAVFSRPVRHLDEALSRADELMQRVKRRGKNGLLIETDGEAQRELAAAA